MIKIKEFELKKKSQTVLTIPNLSLEKEKMNLVLGLNNTGKSVFLRQLHAGNYLEIQKEKKDKRVRSVLIDSQDNLFAEKTVWENLCVGIARPTAAKKNLLKTLAERVGLGNQLPSKAMLLCNSDKKLVELIRATAINPFLILVDDLDKFFDEINILKAISILSLAAQEGATIIASATDKISNFKRNFVIKAGKLHQEGAQIEAQ